MQLKIPEAKEDTQGRCYLCGQIIPAKAVLLKLLQPGRATLNDPVFQKAWRSGWIHFPSC